MALSTATHILNDVVTGVIYAAQDFSPVELVGTGKGVVTPTKTVTATTPTASTITVSITVSGQATGCTWTWAVNGGAPTTMTANPIATLPGNVTVTLYDANGVSPSFVAGDVYTFVATAAAPILAGVTQLVGDDKVYVAGGVARVVWTLPVREQFVSPKGYAGDGGNSPRTIWYRQASVSAHCWNAKLGNDGTPDASATAGDQAAAVEDLVQTVLQACHTQMWNGWYYTAKSGEWVTTQGSSTLFGLAYVVDIEFWIPVTLPPDTQAQINSFPGTTVVNFNDGTHFDTTFDVP